VWVEPYPYVAPPPVVVQPPPPPAYVEPGPPRAWYFYESPRGYYPHVAQCPGGWKEVPLRHP
jgi:hypothetical protein